LSGRPGVILVGRLVDAEEFKVLLQDIDRGGVG